MHWADFFPSSGTVAFSYVVQNNENILLTRAFSEKNEIASVEKAEASTIICAQKSQGATFFKNLYFVGRSKHRKSACTHERLIEVWKL